MEDTIEGKVAAIIDNKIIINRGEIAGVREGMTFTIFTIGEEITDPKTGESIGPFEEVKADVTVIHVQEKMCTTIRIPEDVKAYDLDVEIGDYAREYVSMERLIELCKCQLCQQCHHL
jgi:hypothetical protein